MIAARTRPTICAASAVKPASVKVGKAHEKRLEGLEVGGGGGIDRFHPLAFFSLLKNRERQAKIE